MAGYSSSTFLDTFAPSDILLSLIDNSGRKIGGINVCQYQKSSAEGNELWILMQDKRQIRLDFASTAEAKAAYSILTSAINTLIPNCEFIGVTPGAPPQTINAITYTQYQTLQASNSLVPLQWYDVADTLTTFDLGPTIRLLAKASDDFSPSGVSMTTDELVTINVLSNEIVYREDTVAKILRLNNSIVNQTGSVYITASTQSNVASIDSHYITAQNHSIADVTNSTHIIVTNGSNVTLDDANNALFDNIQEDLSSFAGVLADISVDPTESTGKQGLEDMTDVDDEVLYSYINLVDLNTPTLTADITKVLDNAIPSANGEFRIRIGDNLAGFTITVEDSSANILTVIGGALEGSELVFRWNKNTALYEFVSQTQEEHVFEIVVALDGDTVFAGIAPEPADPLNSSLEVNGQTQAYGLIKDYTIINGSLFWNDRNFTLETDDELILKYK